LVLGKLDLELSPFSIADAVHKVNAALRGALLQKKVSLVSAARVLEYAIYLFGSSKESLGAQELKKSAQVPEMLIGDRYCVEHVIGNLVSNAIKFSPEESEVVVDISVEKHETGP
jgi:signal transduction histidine kinase